MTEEKLINRLQATQYLVDNAPEVLIVAGPGNAKFDLAGTGDRPQNFYIWNSLGMAPSNLMHIVWDNGQYQLTDGQLTATATVTDLAAMGKGAGIEKAVEIRSLSEFKAGLSIWLSELGPWLIIAKTDANPAPARPPKDPVQIKLLFMEAISAH